MANPTEWIRNSNLPPKRLRFNKRPIIPRLGALVSSGGGDPQVATILGTLAVAFATINVVGGFLVTDRMLRMFGGSKRKK